MTGLDLDETRPLQAALDPRPARRLGRLRLQVCNGPDSGSQVLFEPERGQALRAGRSSVNDLVLTDERVSAQHFELALGEAGVLLRDLDSRNGVQVHGLRIREVWIAPGAQFTAGDTTFRLLAADEVEVQLSAHDHFEQLYGRSVPMRELFRRLERLAERGDGLTVFISGETGTGKELIARGLHARSSRRAGPFVVLDCTNIPRDLAESTLFGHARGAFTGAVEAREGCFAAAQGGTLFLDEIGELPLELQAKLLRVLQEGVYLRVGETAPRRTDVRILCATHRDLRRMVADGQFREDLFFRLNARQPIVVPPLRERGDDVLLLASRFLRAKAEATRRHLRLGDPARAALMSYPWPGNVRELAAALEYAACMCETDEISTTDLGLELSAPSGRCLDLQPLLRLPVREAVESFERAYYAALMASHETKGKTARAAGLTGEGLRLALKRLGLG